MNLKYRDILIKINADISIHLKALEPYDHDNRERNKVVECLEETARYIVWEIKDRGMGEVEWSDEDFAQIEDDINERFEE